MLKSLIFSLAMVFAGSTMAFTDCIYEVDSVFIDTQVNGDEVVWVQLRVPGGYPNIAILRDKTSPERLRNNIYTMALTAFTAGKKLQVRYPENNTVCATQTAPRSDFIGLRLIGG